MKGDAGGDSSGAILGYLINAEANSLDTVLRAHRWRFGVGR